MSGWTIEGRIESLEYVIEGYGNSLAREFEDRHEPYITQVASRKRIRASLDVSIERYRYAKGMLAAFKSGGDDIEACWEAEHKFSHQFEWKADKRWRHYFG